MNAIDTFQEQYAGLDSAVCSWRCTQCGTFNRSADTRKRDAAGAAHSVFRAECSKPGCDSFFELHPHPEREAVAAFAEAYEGSGHRDRELRWAQRRSHKTWDKRRGGREAPVQDGPTPSATIRPSAVPDPRAITPPRPSGDEAPDDGYATPHRAPSTDSREWLPWQCPGCGVENLTPPPPGFTFEPARAHEPSPASVRVRCTRCERWYTVLGQRRLVRAATATEAFARAYESTREAAAPWVEVKCPECGSSQYAPPVPSNLGRGEMAIECECGASMIVHPDGSTTRDDNVRGQREAVAAFHTRFGDAVQGTLAAYAPAVRAFQESYGVPPSAPGRHL